jgi:hypothetical protein
MIDLVYILGGGSCHQNKELQLSLLSVKRFLTGYRNIYVIGSHPGFQGDFIHIPAEDNGRNKQDNIRRKLTVACNAPEVSDNFVLMNDDYFFVKPYNINDIPYYYDTNLARTYNRKRKPGHYKRAIQNTLMALADKELPLRHFDIHMPIIYRKQLFMMVMNQFNWQGEKDGFVIKSLYCNTLKIKGDEYKDCNINTDVQNDGDITHLVQDRFMFAVGDVGFNDIMIRYLDSFLTGPVRSEVSETIENELT